MLLLHSVIQSWVIGNLGINNRKWFMCSTLFSFSSFFKIYFLSGRWWCFEKYKQPQYLFTLLGASKQGPLKNTTSWDVGTLRPNKLCCFCSCFTYVLLVCNTLCSAIVWVLSQYWYHALSISYWCLCRPPSWKIILLPPHISYTSLSSSCQCAGPCIVTLTYTIKKDDPMKITCLL